MLKQEECRFKISLGLEEAEAEDRRRREEEEE
jgi:hypothetical protein